MLFKLGQRGREINQRPIVSQRRASRRIWASGAELRLLACSTAKGLMQRWKALSELVRRSSELILVVIFMAEPSCAVGCTMRC